MSTTPYARRRRKKEEYEELPVIRMKDAPAPEEEKEQGDATKSKLIPPDDATDLHLRLMKEPEETVSHETVQHGGAEELLTHITNPDAELPVIHATQPPSKPVATVAIGKPTTPATKDHIKLGPGDTTLWREAVRPAKKDEEQ